jgi:hypothetical protein
MKLEIKPKIGLGELNFGDVPSKVTQVLGPPQDAEEISSDDILKTTIMSYDVGIAVFLEGLIEPVVSHFDLDNENATLFGNKIFNMSEDEVLQLMLKNGYKELEKDTEEWGETRLSFEDAYIDFYFKKDRLSGVSWGILINEDGSVDRS